MPADPVVELARLRNLGRVSAGWLVEVGITSYDDLARLGAVETYLRVAERRRVSLNLLYALEGAVQDVLWTDLSPEERARLREAAAGT